MGKSKANLMKETTTTTAKTKNSFPFQDGTAEDESQKANPRPESGPANVVSWLVRM